MKEATQEGLPTRGAGGARELLLLAFPLIVSNSFWTLQITLDRLFLSWQSPELVGAAMPAVLMFWTPLNLLQFTANYATTFVAQYVGAGRPKRVGPAIWQSLFFSIATGLAFLSFIPLAEPLMAVGGHSPELRHHEVAFFCCLCFAALPTLIQASVASFFAGRGDSWTVLGINATGLLVTALLDYALIFGRWGFAPMGIAGAGWATVAGANTSALVALALFFRKRYRLEFATLSGWKFDAPLFGRLMWFGLPNGVQAALDCLAFTAFTFLVGRFGTVELAATSITFSMNLFVVLPMLGIAQAVEILVGQRLGQDRPELAERSTWTGCKLAWSYMTLVAIAYVVFPEPLVLLFKSEAEPAYWPAVATMVPVLLRFVAVYSLFDSLNLVLSFALRGAGDTRFVTAVSLALAWPIMVLPTYAAWTYGWGLYWAWAFASAYIVALAFTFLLRFLHGKWRTMRVIEAAPAIETDVSQGDPIYQSAGK